MKPRHQPDERSFDEFLQSWLLYMGTVGLFVFVIWCVTRVASDGIMQLTIVWGFLAVVAIGAVHLHFGKWRKQTLMAGRTPSPADVPEVFGGGDGLSLETAVVIHLDNSLSGVGAEYHFIK